MKNTTVRNAWLLSALWVLLIAGESEGGSVANTSHILWPVLHFLFPAMTAARFDFVHIVVRKTGHLFGYAMLSFLLYRSWWATFAARAGVQFLSWREMRRAWSWGAALQALLGTVVVAGLDEWHQSFSPLRGAHLADVFLDELGGLFAQSLILTISAMPAMWRRRRMNLTSEPIPSP